MERKFGSPRKISVDRRHMLRGAGVLSIWSVFRAYMNINIANARDAVIAGELAVDLHCHPFNGRDMPVFGFLQKVVIEQMLSNDPLLQGVAEAFAFMLATFVVSGAPDYSTERKMLLKLVKQPGLTNKLKRNPVNPASDEEFFTSGLYSFIDKFTSFEGKEGLTEQHNKLIIRLIKRYGPQDWKSKTDGEIGAALANPAIRKLILETIVRTILKNQIRSKADLSTINEIDAYIAQFFLFAREFTQYRFQILKDLAAMTGDDTTKLRLLVPALVDLEFWLKWEGESESTSPCQQAELLSLMSLIKLPQRRIVPGFIAFDPWRYMHDAAYNIHPNALEVVDIAIKKMGFIGVKIYPPMGFMPCNNGACLQTYDFPAALQKLQRKLNPKQPNPGVSIDAALAKLYAYCHTNDVAVMAHCSNSIGSQAGYGERAAPINWEPVLKQYPDLRLNLAHWGAIWDLCAESSCTDNPDHTWPKQILSLINATKADGITPAYSNLYVDVGDFSGVMKRWTDECKATDQVFQKLKLMFGPDALLRKRILYGSDWIMLDVEPDNASYYSSMRQFFFDLLGSAPDLDAFVASNALTFLGLRAGDKTRKRLDQFFQRNDQEPLSF